MSGARSKNQVCSNKDCLDYIIRNIGNIVEICFNAKGKDIQFCEPRKWGAHPKIHNS